MAKSDVNKELIEKIYLMLQPYPEAAAFVIAYRDYIHDIDDIIDEGAKRSSENILRVFARASALFTMPFWQMYGRQLLLVEQTINNTFTDSVEWEKSDVPWKINDSNVLRHCGIDMFYAVILLILGRDALRTISSDFRRQAHLLHTNEEGLPV